jgi:predicted RND superfamily exporter protein
MTLVAGFSVFGLSDMYNLAQFGLLSAFAFLLALLADLFFSPALILVLKPLGAEKGQVVE